MNHPSRPAAGVVVLASALLAACAAPAGEPPANIVRAGAPGDPSRAATAAELADPTRALHTEADLRFMRGMIGHHAQALEMTALVADRTTNEAIRLLARRIELSQDEEIARMRHWLERRGAAAEEAGAHGGHHAMGGDHAMMSGMLTRDEMARLERARGAAFDRLFLESMIRHHEGALAMVAELFATDGAGQEAEIFQFATDVDADQRLEIDRMSRMLAALR